MKINYTLFIIAQLALIANCWPYFYLFTQKNPSTYENVDSVATSKYFIKNAETKFLIHGFGGTGYKTKLNLVKDELLKKEKINVFVLDWKWGAIMPLYPTAVKNAKLVGEKIAEFLKTNNINPKTVHCIGHSLGLDPAGPSFRQQNATNRLDKTDADYVDVIHTDSFYGLNEPIGHKDFYPNGGESQPGCGLSILDPTDAEINGGYPDIDPLDIIGKRSIKDLDNIEYVYIGHRFSPVEIVACSHARVPYYYAESVAQNCAFKAIRCADYNSFLSQKCSCSNGCASMGYYSNQSKEEGIFYLETNRVQPYCKE